MRAKLEYVEIDARTTTEIIRTAAVFCVTVFPGFKAVSYPWDLNYAPSLNPYLHIIPHLDGRWLRAASAIRGKERALIRALQTYILFGCLYSN
jgi:hypothetical protein